MKTGTEKTGTERTGTEGTAGNDALSQFPSSSSPSSPAPFDIRLAQLSDAPILARHRAGMFRDMGRLDAAVYTGLCRASEDYFREAMPTGEYVGWLAVARTDADEIVGGAGVQIRPILPRPDHTGRRLLTG